MEKRFSLDLQPQPDDTTCGPTCLHGVYGYWGDEVSLDRVIREVPALAEGGTLAVFLAQHALRRGYRTTIYPYNLQVLDPTWFDLRPREMVAKLRAQRERSEDVKRRVACEAYIDYLELGGKLRFADLTPALLRGPLKRGVPVLTGLSATWLYRDAREHPETFEPDDIGGDPAGHFVVLCGYDRSARTVLVADPLEDNPIDGDRVYAIGIDRAITAILLGIVTYDANLLLIEPPDERRA